jgi:hypothetical protein
LARDIIADHIYALAVLFSGKSSTYSLDWGLKRRLHVSIRKEILVTVFCGKKAEESYRRANYFRKTVKES